MVAKYCVVFVVCVADIGKSDAMGKKGSLNHMHVVHEFGMEGGQRRIK